MAWDGPKWGREFFFSANPDLADILGRTDLDFENFYILVFFGYQIFWISKSPDFQNLARARLGPGQAGQGWQGRVRPAGPGQAKLAGLGSTGCAKPAGLGCLKMMRNHLFSMLFLWSRPGFRHWPALDPHPQGKPETTRSLRSRSQEKTACQLSAIFCCFFDRLVSIAKHCWHCCKHAT